MKHHKITPLLIKQGIDSYPGGICFAMPDGRPILVNQQFNLLTSQLTGHTVMDVLALWTELSHLEAGRSCRRIIRNWDISPMDDPDSLCFQFPDGALWRFRRDILQDKPCPYLQIEAANVTDLYSRSSELLENNKKLRELSQRQHRLLADIVQINRDRELLQAKMRIHADLGRCLIATKKALRQNASPAQMADILQDWENTIRSLSHIPSDPASSRLSMEAELLQVARMIGCQVELTGQRPEAGRPQQLLFASVREALTNAVRHANATILTVQCQKTEGLYHVEISDNGNSCPGSISESGGLSSLRRQLEQEGAILQIQCRDGVRLLIDIPILPDGWDEEV